MAVTVVASWSQRRAGHERRRREAQGQRMPAREPLDALEVVAPDAVPAEQRLGVVARQVAQRQAPEQPAHRRSTSRPSGPSRPASTTRTLSCRAGTKACWSHRSSGRSTS